MNDKAKNILLQILQIIGYSDNKEEFIKKFIDTCYQKALVDLTNTLPQDKQKSLKQQLSNANSADTIKELLLKNFPDQQYSQTLEKTTKEAFSSYIQSITPTLSDNQRSNLAPYLKTLT